MNYAAVLIAVVVIFPNKLKAQEFIGDPTGLSKLYDTKIGQKVIKGDLIYDVKNDKDLDQYFRCHIVTGKSNSEQQRIISEYEEYRKSFGKYAQFAAETFGIPRALLECSLFRETRFETNKTSDANAKGIIQMIPPTYKLLRDEISYNYGMMLSEMRFNQLVSDKNIEEMTTNMFKPEKNSGDQLDSDYLRCMQYWNRGGEFFEQLIKKGLSRDQEKEEYAKCEKKIQRYNVSSIPVKNLQLYMMYAYSNVSTADRTKYFSRFSTRGKLVYDDIVPPESLSDALKNPIQSMGVKAYYLKSMLLQMDDSANRIMREDPVGYIMLLAGGYNAGHGALTNSVKEGGSVRSWCLNLIQKGGEEVKNHMLSLRRCLTKNNELQPTGQDPTQTCDPNAGAYAENSDPCVPSLKPTMKPKPRPENLGKPAVR